MLALLPHVGGCYGDWRSAADLLRKLPAPKRCICGLSSRSLPPFKSFDPPPSPWPPNRNAELLSRRQKTITTTKHTTANFICITTKSHSLTQCRVLLLFLSTVAYILCWFFPSALAPYVVWDWCIGLGIVGWKPVYTGFNNDFPEPKGEITPPNRNQCGPNLADVHRSRSDGVQEILGAISNLWQNGGWDESRTASFFVIKTTHYFVNFPTAHFHQSFATTCHSKSVGIGIFKNIPFSASLIHSLLRLTSWGS